MFSLKNCFQMSRGWWRTFAISSKNSRHSLRYRGNGKCFDIIHHFRFLFSKKELLKLFFLFSFAPTGWFCTPRWDSTWRWRILDKNPSLNKNVNNNKKKSPPVWLQYFLSCKRKKNEKKKQKPTPHRLNNSFSHCCLPKIWEPEWMDFI